MSRRSSSLFYKSSTFSLILFTALGINRRRIEWGWQGYLRIGVEWATRVAIWFFLRIVSFLSSVTVTFCDSYTFSSIVSAGTGINRRRIWWGWQGYLRIGVGVAARVAIRFFVRIVSSFVVCRPHFLQFVYLLTSCFIQHRHPSTPHLMGMTGIPLDWCRCGSSCRNSIFCVDGKCICRVVRRHFLRFVYLLINCFTCLRHQSTQNRMGMTGIPSDWRGVGDSCRNRVFSDNGKCICCVRLRHCIWTLTKRYAVY